MFKKLFGKKEESVRNITVDDVNEFELVSALSGEITELKTVPDPVFSSLALGKGVAIVPTDNEVFAPVNGTVTTLFPTKHAIGITSDNGIEVLVHIGLDTVSLNGNGFESFVKQGDTVIRGQKVLSFNRDKIIEAGLSTITPVVITNSHEFSQVNVLKQDNVMAGQVLLSVEK